VNLLLVLLLVLMLACSSPPHRSVGYGLELTKCNENAKTCTDSIVCENAVRAREGRPLRDVDAGCE